MKDYITAMTIASLAAAVPANPLTRLSLIAAGASGTLLLVALAFEHIGGLRPCELCHWQRYAHVLVVVLGLAAALAGTRPAMQPALVGLLAAALVGAAAVALYHVGVEWKWWDGPAACSGSLPGGLSLEELRKRLMGTPVIRCDEIAWSFLGLSMAGWNFLLSAGLAMLVAAGGMIGVRKRT
jgi:disulfide bond formation protein DsbB